MTAKSKKITSLLILSIFGIASSVATYLWFMPHRNVRASKADAELKVKDLTDEFTKNASAANAKYLSSDGNSKILIIEGHVNRISINQNGETVIILKDEGAKVGVNATLLKQAVSNIASLKTGDIIKVKGVITAGNTYNMDLDLYEHAVLVQCDIVK